MLSSAGEPVPNVSFGKEPTGGGGFYVHVVYDLVSINLLGSIAIQTSGWFILCSVSKGIANPFLSKVWDALQNISNSKVQPPPAAPPPPAEDSSAAAAAVIKYCPSIEDVYRKL
ncbi:hypothetical protein [Pedobacter sp. SYSU D00535]|uniref:hypothetical protein n=1 Tax=Pedobacter sp. SYSU D00535 TaxID=2810308 RepID=UPI001A95CF5A|nr:hypothetical protein [Pedobacter sp. SYSU D00535]